MTEIICPRQTEDGKPFEGAGKWDGYPQTCSYCGSITPQALFEAIDEGEPIDPTDKNYKIYVSHTKKFYFQHLSAAERDYFIRLVNEKKLNLSSPGYFYVLPFFAVTASTN